VLDLIDPARPRPAFLGLGAEKEPARLTGLPALDRPCRLLLFDHYARARAPVSSVY
jgi:hypothetical protein